MAGSGVSGEQGAADESDDESRMGLAVISGLVDDVEVSAGPGGGTIRMSWPTASDADLA